MLAPEEIARYFWQEFLDEDDQQKAIRLLSDEGKEANGLAIVQLQFGGLVEHQGKMLAHFRFAQNRTKFKEGETLALHYGKVSHQVSLFRVKGKELWLAPVYPRNWQASLHTLSEARLEAPPFDMMKRVGQLAKTSLQAGGRGHLFFRQLFGQASLSAPLRPAPALSEAAQRLNPSQQAALSACLRLPPILAIQGPPGTGKTAVLAQVATQLAEEGRRVLLVAHTHQAVHHALNEIYDHAPGLEIFKAGDAAKRDNLLPNIPIHKFTDLPTELFSQGGSIVGTSLYTALLNLLKDQSPYTPEVVIVDEAGQVPLPLAVLLGGMGAKSILLFGDQRQMPPIFRESLQTHPLSCSILAHIENHLPHQLMALDTTYRMNATLTHLIGTLFYPKPQGSSGETFLQHSHNRPFPTLQGLGQQDAFLQTVLQPDAAMVWVCSPNNQSTQENPYEALKIAHIIGYLIGTQGWPAQDMAVVTPFRKQILRIIEALRTHYPTLPALPVIDTVEKLQGQSVELVMVSYTATEADYLSQVSEFLYSPNRLNVSISRAKTKVIFFCADALLDTIPTNYEDLRTRTMLR
jgi:hypothetical protein